VTGIARLLGLRLVTELVAPDVYAEVVLLLGIATLGANLFCAPLLEAAIRSFPDAAAESRVGALRRLVLRLLVPRSAAVALLLPAAGAAWLAFSRAPVELAGFAIVSLYLVLDVARSLEASLLHAARRQTEWGLWFAVDGCLRPTGAVLAILAFGPSAQSVLLGYAAAIACGNLAFRRNSVRGGLEGVPPPEWTPRVRAELLRYAAPLAPLALVAWVYQLSDRYLLAAFAGAEATGIYAAAYGLASMPFIMASGVVQLALRPILNEAVTRGDRARERRTVLAWLAVAAAVLGTGLLLVALLRGPVARVMLGEAFWGAADLLPWVAAAYVVQGLQQPFEGMITAQRRTRRTLAIQCVAAGSALAAYLLLIPPWGARGAAIATLLAAGCSCTTAFALSGFSRRILRPR
jgi:O-antigen/teichoic acid export membrane protein